MINLANQLALYLQSEGEGTLGSNLFVDSVPASPDAAAWFSHVGGSAEFKLDAPQGWRKLSLSARHTTPQGSQDRIWSAIHKLLNPLAGVIEVDGQAYTVQVTSLPALQEKDASGRYIMKAVMILKQVAPVAEPWLEAISLFTETALGSPWRVYRGFNGTCRPSVSWQCMNEQSAAASRGANQLTKQFVGQLAARSAGEYQLAAQALLLGLSEQAKLPMAGVGGRWLTVLNAGVSIRAGDLSTGTVSVTLSGTAAVPQGTFPLIAGLHTATQIDN
ncbi:minor capsid protein [Paenibacillus sp. HWE-109]|uniref:minor capsid protein n=1 Tax=Paenibacillus sp. HWE-109 TaxID=1306526 RepID=UPI001EDFAA81|nr:minor capsid protein [Paenibacillus sp. HWE-109]UKS24888.1 minor capsid protein [Paenibacillus sp. HWE-109]